MSLPPKRKTKTLKVPRSIEDAFKRQAKKLFPLECYAIALGHEKNGKRNIHFLIFPDPDGYNSTDGKVRILNEWWEHARKVARVKKMDILGDIHSHTYDREEGGIFKDASPSQADWERLDRNYIQGICVINRVKGGRLISTLKWWDVGPNLVAEVE